MMWVTLNLVRMSSLVAAVISERNNASSTMVLMLALNKHICGYELRCITSYADIVHMCTSTKFKMQNLATLSILHSPKEHLKLFSAV